MAYHGIDVHPDFQPDITWTKVRKHNTFCICKTSEGTGWSRNAKNRGRRTSARQAGMLWGPYHFARPSGGTGDPLAEAAFAVHAARIAGWNMATDLPMSLDIEATALSPAATLAWCDRFVAEIKRRTGRGCILYTGQWFWDGNLHLRRPPKNAKVLWFSAYTSRPTLKRLLARMFGFKPYIWQYTDNALVAGAGKVDRNVVLVSGKEFRHLLHR